MIELQKHIILRVNVEIKSLPQEDAKTNTLIQSLHQTGELLTIHNAMFDSVKCYLLFPCQPP